ncbi:small acid-soluble spore protein Tlp [Brevibacillus brevis]|uniref:Small acid-soluble spore protein Tlp n=1 Tax=Brevibacillus brevis TaxID=1393 RepID=A0ABY9SWP2_BREBE|nr:small acid-soluble spore protein Tlp [Brevibacillus brevis]WNC12235.1 small acid-soluble spore protein Tlp [Brevibacillus brevis]
MAKPDDRSDNAEKLQEMLQNTEENIRESQAYIAAHSQEMSAEERANLEEKNERRAESIEGYRSEIKDEVSEAE